MNDRFKFRAWDGHKMDTTSAIVCLGVSWNGVRDCPDGRTLMQCTGLKDKNKVEIYEGDIWGNVYGLDLKATVIFHDGRWALRWDNGSIGDLHAHVTTKSGEVIGNIYQHPHLIESK